MSYLLISPCEGKSSELVKWKENQPNNKYTGFTWIWALFPAVMLETVQHASFRIDSLGLLSKCKRQGNAEQFKIT